MLMSKEKTPRSFTIKLNRCTEEDYQRYEMATKPKKHIYTAQQEFEHLKIFKDAANMRIRRQRIIISKIKRGKFKIDKDAKKDIGMVQALAEHDLKQLNKLDEELRKRTAELRRKIHEETINGSRESPNEKV